MNRLNQERLTPVISPIRKYEGRRHQEPFLAGALCVNKLFAKPKDPLDIQVDQLTSSSLEPKPKKKYTSYKQEQHIRLNRESKLKVNEEITNYLSEGKDKQRSLSTPRKPIITRVKHFKDETEQIKDASKQLAEIHAILGNRNADKKVEKKPSRSINTVENSFNEGRLQKTKLNQMTTSHVNHTCAKTLRSKMHNYNSIIEDFEKSFRWDEQQKRNKSKFYFSTYTQEKDPANIKYHRNNKVNIQNTLDALNGRLTKSKEKFLSDNYNNKLNEAPIKPQRISKMDQLNPKRPAPKYKSIKDLKIDENKLRQFEEEVKKRCKFAEDLKETKVLYENEIFKKNNKKLVTDCYSEANLIKNYKPTNVLKPYTPERRTPRSVEASNPRNTRDAVTTPRKTPRTPKITPRLTPIPEKPNFRSQEPTKTPRSREPTSSTSRKTTPSTPRKILVPETKVNDKPSKTIGLSTNFSPRDELQKSVMKSEFLMKEFSVNHEGNLLAKHGRDRNKKVIPEAEIVNWADKFKVKHVRKLPKELDYIMS